MPCWNFGKRGGDGASPRERGGGGENKGPSFFSLPAACRLFSRGVIFTRARVSLALLSLRKNGGTTRSLNARNANGYARCIAHALTKSEEKERPLDRSLESGRSKRHS